MEDYKAKNEIFREYLISWGFTRQYDHNEQNYQHPNGTRVSVCFSPCTYGVRIADKHGIVGKTWGRQANFELFKARITELLR